MLACVHYSDHIKFTTAPTKGASTMAKNLSTATIARRAARAAVKAHYAAKGIRLAEAQARFITKIGMPTNEYLALREAFDLGQPHKPVVKAARVRKAVSGTGNVWQQPAAAPAVADKWAAVKAHIAAIGGDSAWVDPQGTFYKVNFTGHESFATKCAAAGVVTASKYGSYVPSLEAAGWIHISGHMIRNRVEVTSAQVHTLIKWAATSPLADKVVRQYLSA